MTDDKKLIEMLDDIRAGKTLDVGMFNHVLAKASKRLEQLTQGDVVVMPREPTEKMLNAIRFDSYGLSNDCLIDGYKAMIAAAQEGRP